MTWLEARAAEREHTPAPPSLQRWRQPGNGTESLAAQGDSAGMIVG